MIAPGNARMALAVTTCFLYALDVFIHFKAMRYNAISTYTQKRIVHRERIYDVN